MFAEVPMDAWIRKQRLKDAWRNAVQVQASFGAVSGVLHEHAANVALCLAW